MLAVLSTRIKLFLCHISVYRITIACRIMQYTKHGKSKHATSWSPFLRQPKYIRLSHYKPTCLFQYRIQYMFHARLQLQKLQNRFVHISCCYQSHPNIFVAGVLVLFHNTITFHGSYQNMASLHSLVSVNEK